MTGQSPATSVLLVAPIPPPRGGIGTWAEAVRAWASRRTDIVMTTVDTAPRWRPVYDQRRWRRVVWGVGQAWRDLGGVVRSFARGRPDVVHVATSGDLALARDACVLLLARLLRIRSLYHLHFGRLPAISTSRGLERAGFWLAFRLSSMTIVLDHASAAAAKHINPSAAVVVLPYFIDASEWRISPGTASAVPAPGPAPGAGRLRILYVGWVREEKGARDIVAACARLAGRHEFELIMAGPCDAGYQVSLQALAGRDAPWLRFVGEVPREDVRARMETADVFVLPSHSEGFPNVILEAMSLARPIVATRVGAIPQMLEDEGDDNPAGELVPPRDVPMLERALERVVSDAALRRSFGLRARAIVERRYTTEAVCDQYLNLWRSPSESGPHREPARDA